MICPVCNQPIDPNSQSVTASTNGSVWHTACYVKEDVPVDRKTMTHSPEPWHTGQEHEGMCQIEDANKRLVGTLKYPLLSALQGSANSERIVACVNACAGVPTESLVKNGKSAIIGAIMQDGLTAMKRNANRLTLTKIAKLERELERRSAKTSENNEH